MFSPLRTPCFQRTTTAILMMGRRADGLIDLDIDFGAGGLLCLDAFNANVPKVLKNVEMEKWGSDGKRRYAEISLHFVRYIHLSFSSCR